MSADLPPQFAYPMRLGPDGDFLTIPQDSLQEVQQSVYVLMRTPLGVRPLAPAIGMEDPTFTEPDPDVLAATLEDQEDRADVTVTVGTVDDTGELAIQVEVALSTSESETQ
jgi:hypothetical protein